MLLSTTATPLAPQYPPDGADENRNVCPILDITKPNCNCSNFPLTGKVLIDLADFAVPETQTTANQSLNSNDDLEGQFDQVLDLDVGDTDESGAEYEPSDEEPLTEERQDNDDVEQFAEVILMKGTTFHSHFQEALHACKQLMLDEHAPELSLSPEPVNKRDENAIVVKALLGVWKPIGYIPAPKVPKVTDAMRKNEITSVVLHNVIYKYIFACKGHRYFAKILLLKRNRWLPNSVNYEYNDPI